MAKFICTNCNAEYDEMTPDGFCSNQPQCEYGSGWLKEVDAVPRGTANIPTPKGAKEVEVGTGAAEPAPAPLAFEREAGLCILMMDGSLSMGEPAFPTTDYPGDKYQLVSMNASGGIWSLKNVTQAQDAFIALCVFAGKPELVWIKSVQEIVGEYGGRDAFAGYIRETLEKRTPEPRVTNINEALALAHKIHRAYLDGDLTEFGGVKDFKPLTHKVVRHTGEGGEEFISIPNARVLIYTDGEHNVTAAVRNAFEEEEQSVLLSAFIGEEDARGIKQMRKLANTCPRHAPARGFFLIHTPERIQTLKGLFRMASGASGFCPSCLIMEQGPAAAEGPVPAGADDAAVPETGKDSIPEPVSPAQPAGG